MPPGHYVRIDFGDAERSPTVQEKMYWDFVFPDRGQEEAPSDADALISELDQALGQAIRRRLRADVPIAAYLSGGVDSTLMLAKCHQLGYGGMATFTARVGDPRLDESPSRNGRPATWDAIITPSIAIKGRS